MKIGSAIWRFDENRRVYPPEKPGDIYAHGSPIYREHWVKTTITGENTRNWLIYDYKCPKRGPHPGFAFTQQEVDDDVWINKYRRDIADLLKDCRDIRVLRQVAALIGWTATR